MAALAALGLAGCGGGSSATESADIAVTPAVGVGDAPGGDAGAPKPSVAADATDGEDGALAKDVELTKCGGADVAKYGKSSTSLSIKNSGKVARHIHVTIDFYDAEGSYATSGFAAPYAVAPGATKKETTGASDEDLIPAKFTCKVGRVQAVDASKEDIGSVWWEIPR